MKAVKQILFLGSLAIGYNRQIVRALGEHAEKRGDLRIIFPTEFDLLKPAEFAEINVHGFILGSSPSGARRLPSTVWKLPCIDVSAESPPGRTPRVASDDFMVGESAAEYLLSKGFRNLAFYGMEGRHWSECRWRGFERAARSHDARPMRYVRGTDCKSPGVGLFPLSAGRWVKMLPVPCAVFAGDDLLGAELAQSCKASGRRVPVDIAILSVDNDDIFGQWNGVQLSSVRLNTTRIAARAVDLLAELIERPQRRIESEFVAPLEVITRFSTDIFGVRDTLVRKALELAEPRIAEGISVKWLAVKLGVSRATLERRFITSLGRSPAAELARMQAHHARRILINSGEPIELIAERAGYNSARQMRSSLRRQFGQTPSEIRSSNDEAGCASEFFGITSVPSRPPDRRAPVGG